MAKGKDRQGGMVSLVTGATTGLGRALIQRLMDEGDEVRVVLRAMPAEDDADWRRLPPGVIPYAADLTLSTREDARSLNEACRGVNRVFHVAGASYNSNFSYDQLIATNVVGTENLLKGLVEANAASSLPIRFLYTSSVTVFGYRRTGETLTEESETMPGSHYSESKLMAEHVIQSFGETHSKLRHTIIRLGTLYGPGYERPSFFKAFRLIKEQRMRYVGSGTNHLTLIHVEDAADALMLASESQKAQGGTYIITDGVPHTVVSLFQMVAKFMGVDPPKRNVNRTLARLMRRAVNISYDEYEFLSSDRVVDISKARKELGFYPKRRIEVDGLLMVEEFMGQYKMNQNVKNR